MMKRTYFVQCVPGYSYTELLLDEVALEGLSGISLKGLWMRLAARMSCEITESQKEYLWKLLKNICQITFYVLPEPVDDIVILDRFSFVDDFSGVLYEPDISLNQGYVYSPVDGQNGSCQKFSLRIEMCKSKISGLTYEEVLSKWDQRLVMVASAEERWAALAPQLPMNMIQYLQPFHYCLLELVGKSRYNGQATVGRHSLTIITKDPKLLFYQRKLLLELGLVTKARFCQRASFGAPLQQNLLLRLPRFQQERVSTLPNSGILHDLIKYLKSAPGNEASSDMTRKHLGVTSQHFKKILKRVDVQKILTVKNVQKTLDDSEDEDGSRKKKAKRCREERRLVLIDEDEASSSDSDEEVDKGEPQEYECQFRIGVPIARQAYEAIVKSGDKGMTQVELGKYLGMDPFTVRIICRHLTVTKVVYEYLADKGRQRMSRYIAMKFIHNAESSIKYQNEREKLINYMKTNLKNCCKVQPSTLNSDATEKASNLLEAELESSNFFNQPDAVSEIHHLKGVPIHSNKLVAPTIGVTAHPSFRQLRNTNAIIEAVREEKVMVGLHSLRQLESIQFKDIKTLKRALQRLAAIGQIKLLHIKTPGPNAETTLLICDPQIKKNNVLVRMAYNEMCLRSYRNKKQNHQYISKEMYLGRNYFLMAKYQRARLLHEFLFNLAYQSVTESACEHGAIEPGWIYFMDMVPRMSVGLAVGHIVITTGEAHMIKQLSNMDLKITLNAAPEEIKKALLGLGRLLISIKNTLSVLCAMGLVQFGPYSTEMMFSMKDLRTFKFFINRKATIINTKVKKEVGKSLKNNFQFETCKDVKEYWEMLQNVCINTKVPEGVKNISYPKPIIREHPQELANDTGITPGDGGGPGGLDSSFNTGCHLPRLWACRKINDLFTKFKKPKAGPMVRPSVPRKKPCLSRTDLSLLFKKKVGNIQRTKTTKKKSTSIVTNIKPSPTLVPCMRRRKNPVPWSAKEDRILLLCRAAKTFICNGPVAYGGTLCAKLIREILKVSCGNSNKTGKSIIARTHQLEKCKSVVIEQERQLAEARRRPAIVDKFQNLYYKLKVQYLNNSPKFTQIFRTSIMELSLALSRLPRGGHSSELVPAVATSLPELHRCFKLINVHSTDNKSNNACDTSSKFDDISLTTATELIHATLNIPAAKRMSSKKIASTILKIFQEFPEHLLRCAMTQLHTRGIVSFYKNTQNIASMTSSEKISKSAYYRMSAAYNRRMRDRLFSYLPALVTKWFQDSKLYSAVTSSSASACALFELIACDKAELNICVPQDLVSEDSSQYSQDNLCLTACPMDWKARPEAVIEPLITSDRVLAYIEEMRLKLVQKSELPKKYTIPKPLCKYLEDKKECGATFAELEQVSLQPKKTKTDLCKMLKDLERKRYIFRVGHNIQRWVLPHYSIPWLARVNEHFINPRPWLCIDRKINFDILAAWCSAIVFQCAETPGCTIQQLAEVFEYVQIIHIFDLCCFLMDMDVVKLVLIETPSAGLFESDDVSFESYLPLKELAEFESPSSVIVLLGCDAFIKLSKLLSIIETKSVRE